VLLGPPGGDLRRDLGLLADGYLTKPVHPQSLQAAIAHALDPSAAGIEPSADALAEARARLAGCRGADILVVEDVEVNQEMILEMLESAGLKARLASNGVEAMRAVADRVPDLILMDCQMPEMDGFEATRRLRSDPGLAAVPIIAVTADVLTGGEESLRTAGFSASLTKPFSILALFETLARWLAPCPQQAPEAAPLPSAPSAGPREQVPRQELPGIDTQAGLGFVGNSAIFYQKVLKQFSAGIGQSFEMEFRLALDALDWPSAVRLAHSMKGVAQTLGAVDLGRMARMTELAAKDRDESAVAAQLPALLAELARVCRGIEAMPDATRID
jgi:CheY-like chemotaxis protein/HPt (histidine-containing phosphotransfer) domain-containing protein